eukprot:13291970-Ditylum_brightwellii.AAC.1
MVVDWEMVVETELLRMGRKEQAQHVNTEQNNTRQTRNAISIASQQSAVVPVTNGNQILNNQSIRRWWWIG